MASTLSDWPTGNIWNDMPRNIINSPTLLALKENICKLWLDILTEEVGSNWTLCAS